MILLYGIIAIILYFIVLSVLLGNAHNKRVIYHITALFSVVYCCILAVLYVLSLYSDGFGQVLFTFFIIAAAALTVYAIVTLIRKRAEIQFHYSILFALIAYLIAVLYITVFSRYGETGFEIKMELGRFLTAALSGEEPHAIKHAVQNIGMFVPLGILFPLMFRRKKERFLQTAASALSLSVYIELIQLLFQCGSCDIDDVVMNCMGACIGYFFSRYFREFTA